jgi:hypothetical protein
VAPNRKVADEPNLSHRIPATKLEGNVINPVRVATVPRAVALRVAGEISEIYAFCEPSKIPI